MTTFRKELENEIHLTGLSREDEVKLAVAIIALIKKDVIGEDETMQAAYKSGSIAGAGHTIGRNALRQEQRKKLK